jgi:alanine racemase
MHRPLWIEVNLQALSYNFNKIRRIVGDDVKVVATLKQRGYGHGLIPLARQLSREGVDFFGLGDLAEAVRLREQGFQENILILTAALPEQAKSFIDYNITPTITDLDFAKELNRQSCYKNKITPVHVKVDTGMGRLGVRSKNALSFIRRINNMPNIKFDGLYTHFPAADNQPQFTNNQLKSFRLLINKLNQQGIFFNYYHCANSIAISNYKNAYLNLVRPGIILYGIKPSALNHEFKPVLSLKAKVIFVKRMPSGSSISYGRDYITPEATKIATIAVGYADGYPWRCSNKSFVIINDKKFPVVGRVCMDHIMVDVGDCAVKPGDTAIIIGSSVSCSITAEEVADWAGTIPYEVVSQLSLKIPRFYYNSFDKKEPAEAYYREEQRSNPTV